jgi:RHS repeat-associated protein
MPFGEEKPIPNRVSSNAMMFTGHERDTESASSDNPDGLDYMMARYYSSSLGRFMAVDPAAASVKPEKPQTWNRYTYALNNPLFYVDPDGRKYVDKEGQDLKDKTQKDGNEHQKEDTQLGEEDPDAIHTEKEDVAVFVEKDAKGNEVQRWTYKTGNAKDKKDADKKKEEAQKPGSNISPKTGEHVQNPDGSITIKIYEGSRQYSHQDVGKTKGQYEMTVFAHESAEIIGWSHEDAVKRESP